MKISFFKDDRGEWRWRMTARNGRVLCVPGEGFKRISGAINNLRSVYRVINEDNLALKPILEKAIKEAIK